MWIDNHLGLNCFWKLVVVELAQVWEVVLALVEVEQVEQVGLVVALYCANSISLLAQPRERQG